MKPKIIVIDDHESVLEGTVSQLQKQYPEAEIVTAKTAQIAQEYVERLSPDLVVADLSIPKQQGDTARTDTGIQLLKTLMKLYPTLNIVVQSANIKALIRLKPAINEHEGGFTIVDKSLPQKEMLIKVDWSLQGLIYTPKGMRNGLEIKSEWLELLTLAFEEGLQDRTIAQRMQISERTVRNYWTKVQDVLGVYPKPGENIRIKTEKRAREVGLID